MWGKLLLSLAILSMPAAADIPPVSKALPQRDPFLKTQPARKKGRWYMAADGHAVYCFGPTMLVRNASGDFEKVATFCSEHGTVRSIVPLHE